jgi:pimeloyl-ACP methyl ester carboxylesterase
MSRALSLFVNAGGVPTHVAAAGTGCGLPVVFVHGGGLGSDGHGWKATMERLGTRRSYAPDMVGFGLTAAPDIAYTTQRMLDHLRDVLDVLCIERALLVGHSLGATLVARLAVAYPDRVAGAVMVAPGGGALGLRYHSAGHAAMARALTDPQPEAVRALASLMRGNGADTESDAVARLERAQRPGHLAALRAYAAAPAAPTLERDLPGCSVPLMLVWGKSERFNPPDLGDKIAAALPNLKRYVAFERAGHYVHYDEPKQFAATLTDFFNDVEAA